MKGSLPSFTRRIAFPTLLGLALAVPGWAQVIEYKLTAFDGSEDDRLGVSVSLSRNRALVGASLNDDMGNESGSAYVFERQVFTSWFEVAKLTASDGDAHDHFGVSGSLWENRALVGAYEDDDMGNESGSAYVFERQEDGSWREVAKLTASDGDAYDRFGISVSLSRNRALVGAPVQHYPATESGSAYVFERQGDGFWLEVAKLTASDGAADDRFGRSVSLSRGTRALVGAFLDDDLGTNSGSAYMFERQEDGTWIEVAKLTASDGTAGDFFGHSVSLSRDRALVGAAYDGDLGSLSGSAYVFEQQQDGTWIEVAKLTASDGAENHYLGRSVSLVAGTRALVGAPGDGVIDFNGSVYVYERQEDGTWLETTKLTASDGTAKDRFGWSVSLSEDRAVVGAIQDDDLGEASGSAYVFDNLSSLPTAVETSAELPNSYRLSEPYPNPLNPQAQFSLSVSESQHVQIEVFSTLGQRVAVLHDGLLTSRGTHPFTFDAGSLPSGVYLLRVTGETFAATRTMTLLK